MDKEGSAFRGALLILTKLVSYQGIACLARKIR